MTSGYWIFLLMIIPVIAGVVSWLKFSTIDIRESAVSVGVALLTVGLVLGVSQCHDRYDTETRSGRVVSAVHTPLWEAEWTELETYTTTDSKGNVESHTRLVTKHETHEPTWSVETTVGNISVSPNFFNTISKKHGLVVKRGHRPDYDSGDKNDYFSYVKDDPEFCDYPVSLDTPWMNPLKGTKSLHSYKKISDEEAAKLKLPKYPRNGTFKSSRLIGVPDVTIWNWDKMNSALGEQKKINLIMVKLDSVEQAKNLQAYWQNGKKNDIVICYRGEVGKSAEWCYVFGWSETELIKMNLQTLMLDNPTTNDIIPKIKEVVRKDFKPHKWEMYQDMGYEIPTAAIVTAFILMLAIQTGLYIVFHKENTFG